jgi:S1-C subfamily serine protease
VIPATVAVQVGPAQGSGVIVTPDGYVLTAAHVAGRPGRRATLVLHNGKPVLGETLGVFRTMDAGLIKISDEASYTDGQPWPHVEMGDSNNLKPGQWCLATGHPGGFQSDRTPVVRVGRILSFDENTAITTDCTLIGGDSGGPLFDLQGKVVGVHSRIGGSLKLNLHVPVQTYQASWERLAAGEAWGFVPGNRPFIGVQGEPDSPVAKVATVFQDTPAEKAGIRPGDVITRFGSKRVTSFESLKSFVEAEEPGARVQLVVQRGDRRLQVEIVIGRRRE